MTRGSFRMAYLGYLILAAILTNFIASPMVVYAIVSPLLAALCDNTGTSRSKMMFPMMVVCVSVSYTHLDVYKRQHYSPVLPGTGHGGMIKGV